MSSTCTIVLKKVNDDTWYAEEPNINLHTSLIQTNPSYTKIMVLHSIYQEDDVCSLLSIALDFTSKSSFAN